MATVKVGGGRIDARGRRHTRLEREVEVPPGFGATIERAFLHQDPDALAVVFKVMAADAAKEE